MTDSRPERATRSERRSYRVRFDGGNGHSLAGIVDAAADPSAPVAVFSHCFTCNKDLKAIVRISRHLADTGVTVLRFDMTGLGDSEGHFSESDFSTNLADLKAAVTFASQELADVSALIGHSFGGAASLALAGELGSRAGSETTLPSLRCVVALAAPSDTQHLAHLLHRMDPSIEHQGNGVVTIGGRSWRIRREMLEDFRQHQLPNLIAGIRLPVLLFHSPADATVSYDHAIRIQSLIQSGSGESPASLVALPGADHLLIENPADLRFVAETAGAFIRRWASYSPAP